MGKVRGAWWSAGLMAAAATTVMALVSATESPAVAVAEGRILGTDNPQAIPGSYVVVLKDRDATRAKDVTARLAARHNARVVHTYSHALRGFAATMSQEAAQKLANDPEVAFVEQDATVSLPSVSPLAVASWGLDRIDQRSLPLDNSYTPPNTGAGVTVYVIDTGIRTTHVEFGGRAVWGINTTGDGINSDCNGHGTFAASVAGGANYGVAKSVRLVAVKVLNCQGSGSFAGVAAGVDWVTGHHTTGPAVANMSLGASGTNSALEATIRASIADRVVYAISSGHSNTDACTVTPARVTEAITVNVTTSTDARASFSNYGTCTDIFAPGVGITGAWNTGDTASDIHTGSAPGAPHVAGGAALILNASPSLSPAQVASVMYSNATYNKVTNPGPGSPNRLLYVRTVTPPPSTTSAPPAG